MSTSTIHSIHSELFSCVHALTKLPRWLGALILIFGACRRAVCRPLRRYELLRQLTEMRHVNVLESTRVSEFHGEDESSLALCDSLGGILLRSDDYAALFALRHRILCDFSFWSFWDLVVMQSVGVY